MTQTPDQTREEKAPEYAPEYALEIEKLRKTYRGTKKSEEKTALQDVDLRVPKGSIFALLGPNGAGKSTLINILAGLVTKSSGLVRIWNYDMDINPRRSRAAIGVVPQEVNLDPFFTPARLLEIQAGMYGVPKSRRRTQELLDLVGLRDKADSYSRQLSGGMRRRLMVAKALVHAPPVLILDEPTAGVDIELRQQLWTNVRKLNAQGTTIVLTTHYLEEAQELCDRIAIIHEGRIVANEEKETLLTRIDSKELIFRLDQDLRAIPESLKSFTTRQTGKRTLCIRYSPSEVQAGTLIAALQSAGYGIEDISSEDSDLEDIFLQLTTRSAAA